MLSGTALHGQPQFPPFYWHIMTHSDYTQTKGFKRLIDTQHEVEVDVIVGTRQRAEAATLRRGKSGLGVT